MSQQEATPAVVVTNTTPVTPGGSGSPPQSLIETAQSGATPTPQGLGRPPQSPIVIPPTAGDGGLVRPAAERPAPPVVLAMMLSGVVAAGLVLLRRSRV
jgi:hypothetical protein